MASLKAVLGISGSVKSVQRGFFNSASTGTYSDIGIAAVDMNKAVLLAECAPTTDNAGNVSAGRIINATTLRFEYGVPGSVHRIAWQVVEYY